MVDQNSQFYAILTTVGAAKQANADALGIPWVITQMGVGDANGTDPTPDAIQTALINEWRRAPLNQLKVDDKDASIIIAEQVIPADVGGRWIREIGLYDSAGDLVAVANCPPTYKPLLSQGSGRTQVVRMNLVVSSSSNVQLKIDPSVVLATREWVESEFAKLDSKQSVLVATTANIVLSGLQTVDGVALTAGARVLVKNQAAAKDNGIYLVVAGGAWTRSTDADLSVEVTPGMLVPVEKGTANGDSVWQLVTDAPITLGVTALTFEMLAGRSGVTAGTFKSVTVDKNGRVTGGTNPTTLAAFGITDAQPLHPLLTALTVNAGWGLGQLVPATVMDANTALLAGVYGAGGASATNFADAYSPLLVMRRQGGAVVQMQVNGRDNVLSFRGSNDDGASWTNWDTAVTVGKYGIGRAIISAEVDMNKYLALGNYLTPSAGLVNLPAGWSASMRYSMVVDGLDSTSYLVQTLTSGMVAGSVAKVANRTMVSAGVFTDWVVQVSSADKASQADAQAGTDDSKWVTSLRVFQAIAKVVAQATESAFGWAKVATQGQVTTGTDDATMVTPKKLRDGQATQLEAEAGTADNKSMTPLRTFQAIAKVVTQATEAAFGWAKVATQGQVTTGTDDATMVTPKKLRAAQATQAEAEAGALDTKLMTPLRALQLIRNATALATEALLGVLRVGTQPEVDAGSLDTVAVTPKKLRFGFSFSFTTNGYLVLPSWLGGFIIQWCNGQIAAGAGTYRVPLPLEFPGSLVSYAYGCSAPGVILTGQNASSSAIDAVARTVVSGSLVVPSTIVGYTLICIGK